MIREYKEADHSIVNELGKIFDCDYDVSRKSDLEQVIVYERCGKVVGFAQYMQVYEVLELLYIVVSETERGLGLGTEMLHYLEKLSGVSKVILEVRKSNEMAMDFYKKNGFGVLREIKNYHRNGESAFSMEKVI